MHRNTSPQPLKLGRATQINTEGSFKITPSGIASDGFAKISV